MPTEPSLSVLGIVSSWRLSNGESYYNKVLYGPASIAVPPLTGPSRTKPVKRRPLGAEAGDPSARAVALRPAGIFSGSTVVLPWPCFLLASIAWAVDVAPGQSLRQHTWRNCTGTVSALQLELAQRIS